MKKRGISLIEMLITIAIIGGAVAVFGTLLSILRINKTTTIYSSAYKIAQAEIESLRDLPLASLINRTDGRFINILFNNGTKTILENQEYVSAPNALQLTSPTSTPGIILLPENNASDLTLEANIFAPSSMNEVGFLLRARDLENNYHFYIKNDRIILEKNIDGTPTILYENIQAFNADTWYKIKIVASSNQLSLYLNDLLLNTVVDNTFTFGYTSLINEDGTDYFDDILLTSENSKTWNFDNSSTVPDEWQVFSIYDLPQGNDFLTISEPYGDSTIKQIDVVVSWIEKGEPKSITISTLKTE